MTFQKQKCVAFLQEHFPDNTGINYCQRRKPGKVSFHFTLSGISTTPAALKQHLKHLQGGHLPGTHKLKGDNNPFDLKCYGSWQKYNAPNQQKESGGPIMAVVDGTVLDNTVQYLDGTETEIYWGFPRQQSLDSYKTKPHDSLLTEEVARLAVQIGEVQIGEMAVGTEEPPQAVIEVAVEQKPVATKSKKKPTKKSTKKSNYEKQGPVTMVEVEKLESKLSTLDAPQYVSETASWRLITTSIKAMFTATSDDDVRVKLMDVWDKWSQLSPSTYDKGNNQKKWDEMKDCGTFGLRYILAQGNRKSADSTGFTYNSEIAAAFCDLYEDDFYYIDGKGETLVGLKYCEGNVWIEGGFAEVKRRQMLQGPFCDKMVEMIEAHFEKEKDKAAGNEEALNKVEEKRWAAIHHPKNGIMMKLKEGGPARTVLEKMINDELMERKPTYPDDVRFNTQPENNDLLAFQNGVLDMSKLAMNADGYVNWKDAMRDYRREDHFLKGHRLPYEMGDVGQEHIDFANDMIDQILPPRVDPVLNQSMRGWLAYCTTGYTSAEKFMVWTGYDGENGKSKLAGLHMKSLPTYSAIMNGATMYETSQDEHKHLAKCMRNDTRFALLEELDAAKKIDRQRLCHIVDGEQYVTKMLFTTLEASIWLHGKWNFTGNADPNLPNDGGVKRRVQQAEFTQKFVKQQDYDNSNGDANPNMHLQKAGILDSFNDKTNHDPKLGYLHCLLPSIVAFYANGKKPQVDQKFSDSAKSGLDEGCWITMAINENLTFLNIEDDRKTTKKNWKIRENWMTKTEMKTAIMQHPMAQAHSHMEWESLWRQMKGKNSRLREAYDKDKSINGKGHFFGVRRAPPPGEGPKAYNFNSSENPPAVVAFSGQGTSVGTTVD